MKLKKPYIYGIHAVREALSNPKRKIKKLYLTKDLVDEFEISVPYHIVSKEDLNQALGSEVVHQGIVLEVESLPEVFWDDILRHAPENCQILILDQVSDPHNVGAITRSAAAFGAYALVQQEKNAPEPDSPVIAKIASGAMEYVTLVQVPNLSRAITQLQEENFWVIGLDEEGEATVDAVKLTGRICFVLGREGKGLRRLVKESCDQLVQLPTQSNFPTLNVSNAAAVALYEYVRQNRTQGL